MNLPCTDRGDDTRATGRTALILEDDEVAREALTHWLAEEGFAVHTAGDGHDAADWLARHGADILIVDRVYPAWEGLGTLQAVRRLCPDIRILVTGRGAELDDLFLPMARSIGADLVLTGPLTRDALRREIRILLH